MHLTTGLRTHLGPGLEKIQPVHVGPEDVLLAVPMEHDVIGGVRILHSEFAVYDSELADAPLPVNSKTIYSAGPLLASSQVAMSLF